LSSLKTLYNGRKAMQGLIKKKITGARIPVRVSLLVTKYCNLECFYCYAEDVLNVKEIPEFTLKELKKLIDEIYDSGCRWVNILGGEPLIRNDIEEIIDYLHDKGMFIELTTNGYFVKKRIEALKKLDHLAISLDGNKDSNDKARGEGSFEKIIDGIQCAVDNGIKVRVHATLCKKTMQGESFDFLVNYCKDMGVGLNYSENGLPGIEKLDPDYLLSEEEALSFYQGYEEMKAKGYPIVSSETAVDYVAKWPLPKQTTIYKKDLPDVPKDSFYPCQLGRNQCFISADGNVYPCTKKWGEGKNVREVGFKKAWETMEENLDCVACKELGTIEQSLITGLQPKALVNAITNFVF
jgi:MoaA/NifB/PqqE/SkfB family radical SAM enzyme